MNDALQDIYRQSVISHSQQPHNRRNLANADREVLGFNRLCGDKLTVFLKLDDERIADASFEGTGCAISVASASMMTDAIQDASITEAADMIAQVSQLMTDGTTPSHTQLQEVMALEGVRAFPSRIKCANLAWSALAAALQDNSTNITTTE